VDASFETKAAVDGPARLITWPFVAVTAAAMLFFVYVGMLVVTVPRFVENELAAGELGVGMTVAAFAGAAILIRPVIGWAGDRYGRRRIMIVGASMASVAGIGSGFADSLWQLLVLRGLTGVGEAALFVGAATLIADMSPPHRRAEAASYFSVAVFGGLGVGPVLGELLLGDDRYLLTFTAAGMVAALSAASVLMVPRRVDLVLGKPNMSGDGAQRHALIHPAAIWPGLVLAAGISGFAVFSAFLPEYSRDVGLSGAAALFVVYSIISVVLRIAAARLPERLGIGKSVGFALVFLAGGLTIASTVPSAVGLWLAMIVISIGMAFLYPALMASVVNSVGEHDRARAMSSFTMFFEVGSVVGGLALGSVAELLSKRAAFAGAAAFAVIGLVILRTKVLREPAPLARDPERLSVIAGE
jgi:MFS family permease